LSKHRTRLRALLAATAICSLVVLGGCGLSTRATTGTVTVTVTRDFGAQHVRAFTRRLNRPQSIAALLGGSAHGAVFINGVNRSQLPAAKVYPGDRVWLDLQPTSGQIRAAVGSFPEPFIHGVSGKRLPVTMECATDVATACKRVSASLANSGVATASQLLGTGSGQSTAAVVVGTWQDLKGAIVATLIADGPRSSGVFARSERGQLQVLDQSGRVVRTLGAGGGLIAATADSQSAPTWLITGADVAGVNSAARALTASRLRDRFALAIDGAVDVPLPDVRLR
jgi:hypothetical protein